MNSLFHDLTMARETNHTVPESQQQNNEGQAAGTKAVRMCKQGEDSNATHPVVTWATPNRSIYSRQCQEHLRKPNQIASGRFYLQISQSVLFLTSCDFGFAKFSWACWFFFPCAAIWLPLRINTDVGALCFNESPVRDTINFLFTENYRKNRCVGSIYICTG